jgi:hypothetical protein
LLKNIFLGTAKVYKFIILTSIIIGLLILILKITFLILNTKLF